MPGNGENLVSGMRGGSPNGSKSNGIMDAGAAGAASFIFGDHGS